MRIIGLTGSIACGKSMLSRYISENGYPVIDGDQLSRDLTAPGGAAIGDIWDAFGPDVFMGDGRLNRRALADRIFSDPAEREKLDRLMAPHLKALTLQRIEEARTAGALLCFLDFPLLFEKGYDVLCDTTWCVWIPEELQLKRLMARDHFTEEEAMSRIRAVLSTDEKAKRADVVIDNSGDLEDTLKTVAGLIEAEKALATPKRRRNRSYAVEVPAPLPEPAAEEMALDVTDGTPDVVSSGTPARMPPAAPPPAPAEPDSSVFVMERPAAARKGTRKRTVSWALPSWLMIVLIAYTAVLAIAFTAQCLMSAYLTRQAERHIAEQKAIDENYPLEYRDWIEKYAEEYNLRPSLVSAIIRNESSFRPMAESSVGARGLMQLMPDTAEWIAQKLKVEGYAFDRMYDPESNIRFGCWYLNYLSNLFRGDPVSVISAYHAGQGEIAGWLSNKSISSDGRTLTTERLPEGPTKTYAERVTRDYGIYEAKYFQTGAGPASAAGDAAGPASV